MDAISNLNNIVSAISQTIVSKNNVADISDLPGTSYFGEKKPDISYGSAVLEMLSDIKRELYRKWSDSIAEYTRTASNIAINGAKNYYYIGGKVDIMA